MNRSKKTMAVVFAVLVALGVYSAIQIDEINRPNTSGVPAVIYPYPYETMVLRPNIREEERLKQPVLLLPRAIQ